MSAGAWDVMIARELEQTRSCGGGDHDGAKVPAVVMIIDGFGTDAYRCLYCAERLTSAYMRRGDAFAVVAVGR